MTLDVALALKKRARIETCVAELRLDDLLAYAATLRALLSRPGL